MIDYSVPLADVIGYRTVKTDIIDSSETKAYVIDFS